MTGTTAGNPLDRFSDAPSSPLAAAPTAVDVEIELQRIARQRLAPPTGAEAPADATHGTRSFRHRRQPLTGAFDSPEGFAFTSR
jgi:hypothetical protein